MTSLREQFSELAVQSENDVSKYSTQHLKQQLQKEWPELTFVSQPGHSDIVCSSDLSIADAVRKINTLGIASNAQDDKADILLSEMENDSDESIVYKAMGILRKRVRNVRKLNGEYYSSQEMDMNASKMFVDPLLYQAIGWLTNNDKFYTNAEDLNDKETDSKSLNIACDIVSLATGVMSPKHLGLSVHLHHTFGSRKLVEEMYQLGYGISYTELRRFLSNAAQMVTSSQKEGPAGSFVPPQLVPKSDGGKQVVAVGDNWDHNERTVDGKNTTHAMTSMLITPGVEKETLPRIPRIDERTLDVSTLPGDVS